MRKSIFNHKYSTNTLMSNIILHNYILYNGLNFVTSMWDGFDIQWWGRARGGLGKRREAIDWETGVNTFFILRNAVGHKIITQLWELLLNPEFLDKINISTIHKIVNDDKLLPVASMVIQKYRKQWFFNFFSWKFVWNVF